MAEEVKLFETWSSPFLRVVWELHLKGIQYESVLEDLSDNGDLLLQYYPVHKKVVPSIWSAFKSEGKRQEAALARATEHLQKLEEQPRERKFFGRDNIGCLDIPWSADLVRVFEEISSLRGLVDERFPLLSAWLELSNAPIIKDCRPPHDKLISEFIAPHQYFHAKSSSSS